MAKLCLHCGVTLERDEARFCQNCGKSTSPRLQSPTASAYSASPTEASAIKQPEQHKSALRVQVVKQPGGGQSSLPEQIAQQPELRQPEQNKLPIRVQVVKQPEERLPSLPEQSAQQPEPRRQAIRIQVVTQPGQDRSILREQVASQPPVELHPPSQPDDLVSDSEPERDELDHTAVSIAEALVTQEEIDNDGAGSLQAGLVAAKIEGEVKQVHEDEQVADAKDAQEERKVEASSATPGAEEMKPQARAVSWPGPMTHVSVKPPVEEASPSKWPAQTFAAEPLRTDLPAYELHAKLWDQYTTTSSDPLEAPKNIPAPREMLSLDELPSTPPQVFQDLEQPDIEEGAIEDSPTLLLESIPAEETKKDRVEDVDIEDCDTVSLPLSGPGAALPSTQPPRAASVHENTALPQRSETMQPALMRPQSLAGVDNEQPKGPVVAQPIPAKFSSLPDTATRRHTFPVPVVPRTSRRLPVTLVAAILVALVLIAIGSWVFIAQPFSVPAVTQPQVSFSDANLGLSLLYPNGWASKQDTANSTVQFYDSSHTAQVIIAVSSANTSPITTYLQKQAAQLGMSGAKNTAPLSFAGASWQSIQGTVQQGGANYTCTVFATIHANHLVMLTQLAPQSIYNDEDSIVFSALRQSLRWL